MPTKYLIGIPLTGPAADWHQRTAGDISDRFGTWDVAARIAPHVTLVRPFDTNDATPIKTFLRGWTDTRRSPGSIGLGGFDHFDETVVFVKTMPDPEVREAVESLRLAIAQLPMMPKQEDFPDWHPHASLAYKLPPSDIRRIWLYVQTLAPEEFRLRMNELALLRFEQDGSLIVEERFPFSKPLAA